MVLDNLVHGHRAIVEQVLRVSFIEADLADRHALHQALEEHAIEAVLHFAAYSYCPVPEICEQSRWSFSRIESAVAVQLKGALVLL
jgi:UDP-glucose 4-epimerase